MTRRSILLQLSALAILLAAPLGAFAQQAATPAADVKFPIASRLGIVPPAGMTISERFQGFEDAKNDVYIRLVAMPDNAYSEIEKSMTNQALKKQNITVERREPFTLPSAKGLLVVARQESGTDKLRKWLLVAPVGSLTALVSLEIPLAAKKDIYPEATIRAAFATLTSRDKIPAEEQLSLLPFRLSALAGFQVSGVVPGRAVQLTDDGKETNEAGDRVHLVIGLSPGAAPAPGDRDSFARLAFSSPPNLKDVRILSSEPMRIAGQPGHEMRVTGKDAKSGADVEVVQWLRFGSGAYMRIVGFAPKDGWVEALSRFRTVRDGVEPR